MKELKGIEHVYFLGIGGIGMSALARYFRHQGITVSGYDRSRTALTDELIDEGVEVHFEDDPSKIPSDINLIVYTPAIPKQNREWIHCIGMGVDMMKRAEVLGLITQDKFCIAVAGSHGKTTVSAMITHLLKESGYDCTAFLGGIALNYNSNFIAGKSDVVVVEADEYDRSFHRLYPDIAVITAVDTDHLDVYGTRNEVYRAFRKFASQIKPNGMLVMESSIRKFTLKNTRQIKYSLHDRKADYYVRSLYHERRKTHFDLNKAYENLELNYPGIHNLENAVGAIVVGSYLGIGEDEIRNAMAGFTGVSRRFEYIINTHDLILIDDYAHHPKEIEMLLRSVREIYPERKVCIIFQPHLYSRTRDLQTEFAETLDMADEIILLDLYPAREEAIEGVDSALIASHMKNPRIKLMNKEELLADQTHIDTEIVLTVGAGDVDRIVKPLSRKLSVQLSKRNRS